MATKNVLNPAAFLLLHKEKKKLAARMKQLDEDLDLAEAALAKAMAAAGEDTLRVGLQTIKRESKLSVAVRKGVERDVALAALKVCGLGELVKEDFNVRSLTALVRDTKPTLGKPFHEAFETKEKDALSVSGA